ncbi:MAG TPA: DUF1707 and DUF4870 domain-containing protein [Arachnia sp.]|nr:DUF1707 and DUF4870 domain-containing protein [Arachnia sp.]HMT87141.1 DUF1707 and DUF4870 domain-containing protein [Arachnia sp.]
MMPHDSATQSLVTDAQRDMAVKQLSRSYGEGAIDEAELDRRLELALGARTRAELNQSLAGLVRIRPTTTDLQPRIYTGSREPAGTQNENLGAGLVHLSGLAGFFLAPAIVKAVSQPGSRVWWEASRALGFQISTLVYGAATMAAAMILPGGGFWWTIFGLGWVAWFVLTLVGSARAFSGQQSFPQLERYMVVKPKLPRQ